MKQKCIAILPLMAIVLLAIGLRIYGITWGFPYHYHPDEITIMHVVHHVRHELNPRFSIYGSLPIFLITVIAYLYEKISNSYAPEYLFLTGRLLSVIASVLTVALVYWFARRISSHSFALLASLLLATNVLSVQQAHYAVVDSQLTFFLMIGLMLQLRYVHKPSVGNLIGSAVIIAMGMAVKLTASLLTPLFVGLIFFQSVVRKELSWMKRLVQGTLRSIVAVVIIAAMFLAFSPHFILDYEGNVKTPIWGGSIAWNQEVMSGKSLQRWTNYFLVTTPYLYHLTNLLPWAMSLPTYIMSLLGIAVMLFFIIKPEYREQRIITLILLAYFCIYFGFMGRWFVKYIRYMLPLIPILCIAASLVPYIFWKLKQRLLGSICIAVAVAPSLFFTLAYDHIYSSPDTRTQAKTWIDENIPEHATIILELEHDVYAPPNIGAGQKYNVLMLEPVSVQIIGRVETRVWDVLDEADWIILSNRHYPTYIDAFNHNPEQYPEEARFYSSLIAGTLEFELVATFENPPSLCGFTIDDSASELTFHIFDHPQIFIFKKKG